MNRIVLNKFNNHYRQHSILLNFYYRIRERQLFVKSTIISGMKKLQHR